MISYSFYFWQNTNSLHQSSFLEALALRGYKVTLVVTEPLSPHRKAMGWTEPILQDVEVIRINQKIPYEVINCDPKTVHIFSGINAFSKVQKAFLYAIEQNARIGIFTEPLDFRGWKGLLRNTRGFWYRYKYGKYIECVLATGRQGVSQFEHWGYNKDKIFEWGYTVKNSDSDTCGKLKMVNDTYKIVFVGSLFHWKGYDLLVNAVKELKDDVELHLFCYNLKNEHQVEKMRTELKGLKHIRLHPFLANDKLRKEIRNYDLLILPSRYDGWGTVINESLMEGTPVLVSSKCGASTVVTNNLIGETVDCLDVSTLKTLIIKQKEKGKLGQEQRTLVRNWAEKHISGSAMSNYFEHIIEYVNGDILKKPLPPWHR